MTEIIVLAKPPIPGRVKTRLVPPLTPGEAARFAAAFLSDLLAALRTIPSCRVLVALPPGESRETLADLVPEDVSFVDQGPGDLGAKLDHVITEADRRGAGPVAVVGSDHPDLPRELIESMTGEARRGRIGWIPTGDGGFAAMALPGSLPGLFDDVAWSTPEVAAAIRRNARELGRVLVESGYWHDVDTAADLHRLARRLAAGDHCPATRNALRELAPPLLERHGAFTEEGER